jgi:hypothetical protein
MRNRVNTRSVAAIVLGASLFAVGCDGEEPASSPGESPTAVGNFEPSTSRDIAPILNGGLDAAECDSIRGWARDAAHEDTPVRIDLYDGDMLLVTVIADQFRDDLFKAKKGTGKHGFRFATPARLKDGKPHSIKGIYSGTTQVLERSPRTLTCSAENSPR